MLSGLDYSVISRVMPLKRALSAKADATAVQHCTGRLG
jgi:hypothetical protein